MKIGDGEGDIGCTSGAVLSKLYIFQSPPVLIVRSRVWIQALNNDREKSSNIHYIIFTTFTNLTLLSILIIKLFEIKFSSSQNILYFEQMHFRGFETIFFTKMKIGDGVGVGDVGCTSGAILSKLYFLRKLQIGCIS